VPTAELFVGEETGARIECFKCLVSFSELSLNAYRDARLTARHYRRIEACHAFSKMLLLTFIAVPLLFAQAPPASDEYWPKEIATNDLHLVLYQPQVDSWKGNRIEARSAVMVTLNGDSTQIFGTVAISARTEVDKETRLVGLEDIAVKEPNFPSASALQGKLRKAVRESVPNWPRTISLDRLLADLSINQKETKAETTRLKNDPPGLSSAKCRPY